MRTEFKKGEAVGTRGQYFDSKFSGESESGMKLANQPVTVTISSFIIVATVP
jgi:hypothetical protein